MFYSYFRRELLHSYGFEYMIILSNLEKAGLVKKQVELYAIFMRLSFLFLWSAIIF